MARLHRGRLATLAGGTAVERAALVSFIEERIAETPARPREIIVLDTRVCAREAQRSENTAKVLYNPSMPKMNVNLTADLAAFVAEQIRDGGYTNQSEVAREALRLLRLQRDKRRDLLAALDAGHADSIAGRTKPLTDDLLHDIAARAATP